MKKSLPTAALLLAGIWMMIAGCASSGSGRISLSDVSPSEIVDKIRENRDRIRTLSGKGKILIAIPGTPFRGDVKILVNRPDSLFIATEAPFGIDVGFLFADGTRFTSYSPLDNTQFTGPVDQMGRMVLFQLRIGYEELLNAVLGTPVFPLTDSLDVQVDGNDFVFSQKFRKHSLRYEVDGSKFVVKRVEVYDENGEPQITQVFRRFRKVDGVWVPQYVQLTRPKTKERLTVYYQKIELNVPLQPAAFDYSVPAGAKKEELGG